jgi:tRNA threonylcarbamoyladenosine modification (KEOPS) complex  Pcc1 subunit
MTAGKYNITIEQGSTYVNKMTFYTDSTQTTPIDFTGYTWRMQIRIAIPSTTVLLELTSEDGRIDISDQANGVITLNISATDTAALNFGEAVYDIESILAAVVDRKLYGSVTLSKEVTR